jgi:transposase
MAAKRIEIMDVRQIVQLKIRGFSNRKIAGLTGIHRNSVNHYVQLLEGCNQSLEQLLDLTDAQLAALLPSTNTTDKDRYQLLSTYFSYFHQELKKPGCTRRVLWEHYIEKHPEGYSYTQFCEHLNRYFKRVKASGKLQHKAGDKLFVDFTGKQLSYVDRSSGQVIGVEVFVGTLPCSGYTFVQACASQKKEDLIGVMNNCLYYLGGVPQAIVPDNLKSAVTKGSKYEPLLNKTFKDFALHYGCALNPTRTHAPQDKALVEGAVKLVYQRIFYPLSKMTFFSLADLNTEIRKLLDKYNDYLLSHVKVSRRDQFYSIEQAHLAPLPAEPYQVKTYKRATVQKMGYIFVSEDKNYYSVPYRFIGKRWRYATIVVVSAFITITSALPCTKGASVPLTIRQSRST